MIFYVFHSSLDESLASEWLLLYVIRCSNVTSPAYTEHLSSARACRRTCRRLEVLTLILSTSVVLHYHHNKQYTWLGRWTLPLLLPADLTVTDGACVLCRVQTVQYIRKSRWWWLDFSFPRRFVKLRTFHSVLWTIRSLSLYHNCNTTTTRLRRKIDMFVFCSRRIASNGSRRARYVVVVL